MMTPVDALRLALQREAESRKLYSDWAVRHPAIRELCEALAAEEQKHELRIREKLAEITAG